MSLFKKLWNRLLWVQYKVNVWCANMNRWFLPDPELEFEAYLVDRDVDVRIEQLTKKYQERKLK